jgi:hypothetical protein
VTEHGVRSAGEHGGHPAPAGAEDGVADGVDAGVNAVQAARGRALGHRLPGEAERDELPGRDDPVLSRGEGRDRPLGRGWAEFDNLCLTYPAHRRHARERGRETRAADPANAPIPRSPGSLSRIHPRRYERLLSRYPFVANLLLALRAEDLGAAFATLFARAETAAKELLARSRVAALRYGRRVDRPGRGP